MATNVKTPDTGGVKDVPIVRCGIVGPHAVALIAEAALAIEMEADISDQALQQEFLRRQVERMSNQTKELGEHATQTAGAAARPKS